MQDSPFESPFRQGGWYLRLKTNSTTAHAFWERKVQRSSAHPRGDFDVTLRPHVL